jgi:hypothetical protein
MTNEDISFAGGGSHNAALQEGFEDKVGEVGLPHTLGIREVQLASNRNYISQSIIRWMQGDPAARKTKLGWPASNMPHNTSKITEN